MFYKYLFYDWLHITRELLVQQQGGPLAFLSLFGMKAIEEAFGTDGKCLDGILDNVPRSKIEYWLKVIGTKVAMDPN